VTRDITKRIQDSLLSRNVIQRNSDLFRDSAVHECAAIFDGCTPLKMKKTENRISALRGLKIPGWNYSDLPWLLIHMHEQQSASI
jgi:hypothetical protein